MKASFSFRLSYYVCIVVVAGALLSACRKDYCEAIVKAELFIPPVVKIFNSQGDPVVDPATRQQLEDTNMMVYNQRTGEYFSPGYGSRAGVQLGDVLQIGVRVFNDYEETPCNRITAAPESKTGFQLTFVDTTQRSFSYTLPNAHTPPIAGHSSTVAVIGLQVNAPGYYYIKATADVGEQVPEYDENNNLFQNPDTGANMGRKASPMSQAPKLLVTMPAGTAESEALGYNSAIVPTGVGTTRDSWHNSALARFMKSSAYAAYQANRTGHLATQSK